MGIGFKPTIGICDKCGTEKSYLFEYRSDYWICKANECFQEEVERDSGRHVRKNDKLEDYRKLVAGTGG